LGRRYDAAGDHQLKRKKGSDMVSYSNQGLLNRGLLVMAIASTFVLFFIACGEAPPPPPIRPVLALKVADAESFSGRKFPGQARATQEANLSFEVAGTLVERVDVGDQVQAGDLLGRLDPRDFQNELDRARAERERALAQRDRVRKAGATGAVSRQDMTDAEARYSQAVATVNIKQKALNDTHIFAPFDGTVAATYVEKFEAVKPKQSILRLLDTSKIEMIVNIPESTISNAPYVKEVWIRFDAFPNREFPARIKEISNEASQTTRTYPVTLIMDAPDDIQIQPGMAGEARGTLELPADLAQVGYEIPLTAVFSDKDKSYVWVIDEASKTVSRREVEPGEITPRGIVIRSGVNAGEWIAAAGVHYLREGQQVRILEPGGGSET
jgi:RND family efflux transporter MFP subunit